MRAQTSTEYLIMVSVVIVIAILVVISIGDIGIIGSGTKGNLEWKAAQIGIDALVVRDGNETIDFKNNYDVPIDLEKVFVNTTLSDLDNSEDKLPGRSRFAVGQKKKVNIGDIVNCTTGEEVTLYLKLEFVNTKNQAKFNTTIKRPYSAECAAAVAAIAPTYALVKDGTEDAAAYTGSCQNPTYGYDEDYGTAAVATSGLTYCYIYENFTKPSGTVNATLEVKYSLSDGELYLYCLYGVSSAVYIIQEQDVTIGTTTQNFSIPSSCLSEDPIRLRTEVGYYSGEASYFESSIWWNATS